MAGWECSTCTLFNAHELAPVCEVCLTPRHPTTAERSHSIAGGSIVPSAHLDTDTTTTHHTHHAHTDSHHHPKKRAFQEASMALPPPQPAHDATSRSGMAARARASVASESCSSDGASACSVGPGSKRSRQAAPLQLPTHTRLHPGFTDAIGRRWESEPPVGQACVLCRGVDFSAQSDRWTCGYQNLRMVQSIPVDAFSSTPHTCAPRPPPFFFPCPTSQGGGHGVDHHSSATSACDCDCDNVGCSVAAFRCLHRLT